MSLVWLSKRTHPNTKVAFNWAYKLYADPQGKTSRQGTMSIHTGDNVEENKSGIGLAIGGNPALVVNATPNFDFNFLPNIKYWIAFGNFEKGEVLDLNSMTNVYEVCFEVNQFEKVIVLKFDNTWEEI